MRLDSIILLTALTHFNYGLAFVIGNMNPSPTAVKLFQSLMPNDTAAGIFLICSCLLVLYGKIERNTFGIAKLLPQQFLLFLMSASVFKFILERQTVFGKVDVGFVMIIFIPTILLFILHSLYMFEFFLGLKWIYYSGLSRWEYLRSRFSFFDAPYS